MNESPEIHLISSKLTDLQPIEADTNRQGLQRVGTPQ
eukprot:COSAG06_NODE_18487_length_884_cov_1.125954_1_plen_36_part_10